jgi:hypothetical protein
VSIAAAVVAALALLGLDLTYLHPASSAPSASSGTARQTEPSQPPAPGSQRESGSSAGRSSAQPGPSTSSRGHASTRVVLPAVTVTGVAALPTVHVHAGYTTPADAVDGFYQALLGGTPTQACAYATSPCPAFGSARITGNVSIVDAISHGDEALVEVTGTICHGATCVPLTDRVLMPTGPASFSTSWASLTAGVYGWAGSPLPCVRDATGQWHVKLS